MAIPLIAVFRSVPDPRRVTENKLHLLGDILVIATCAVISGAESWDSIHGMVGPGKCSFAAS